MSSKPEIRAVVFDLAGVMIDVDWNRLTQLISQRSTCAADKIIPAMLGPDSFVYERGGMSTEQFYKARKEELGFKGSHHELLQLHCEALVPREKDIAVLGKVDPRLHRAVLSNISDAHREHWDRTHGFLGQFHSKFFSYELRTAKPHEEIYGHVEKGLAPKKVKPEHILFLDDNAENIAMAKKRGWNTVHVEAHVDIHGVLERQNLLAPGATRHQHRPVQGHLLAGQGANSQPHLRRNGFGK